MCGTGELEMGDEVPLPLLAEPVVPDVGGAVNGARHATRCAQDKTNGAADAGRTGVVGAYYGWHHVP